MSKVKSRRDKIINAAMELFAVRGYASTSTKQIATESGVSEALIFKHFENKNRLLSYIVKTGYSRIILHHKGMMSYQSPEEFLRNMIELPSKLVKDAPLFWKMQERLHHDQYSKSQHENFMKPVKPVILKAFQELGYAQPELETQFLLYIIDMLWKKEATGDLNNAKDLVNLIEQKYRLV